MKDKVFKKFIRYLEINTQSKEDADSFPSTGNQFDLANLLADELKALGLEDAGVDDYCYVMATLPANIDKEAPKIGLIAHMDTSPEVSGENIRPQTIETYEGGDIVKNDGTSAALTTDRKGSNPCKKVISSTSRNMRFMTVRASGQPYF